MDEEHRGVQAQFQTLKPFSEASNVKPAIWHSWKSRIKKSCYFWEVSWNTLGHLGVWTWPTVNNLFPWARMLDTASFCVNDRRSYRWSALDWCPVTSEIIFKKTSTESAMACKLWLVFFSLTPEQLCHFISISRFLGNTAQVEHIHISSFVRKLAKIFV